MNILQDTCNFSDQDWIWIFIFEKNWIRTGSVYLFVIHDKISLRVTQDVTNNGGSVFFTMDFLSTKNKPILSVCATQSMKIRVTLS